MNTPINDRLLTVLACPACGGDINSEDGSLACANCGLDFEIEDGIPIMILPDMPREQLIAVDTWGKEYRRLLESHDYNYLDPYGLKDYEILENNHDFSEDDLFLELGCGRARVSLMLSKKGVNIVGLDVSLDALKLAKESFKYHKAEGLFVCGDMLNPPFKRCSFDHIFAGGSLEHLRDTKTSSRKIYELVKPTGKFTATVPCVSLSTLPQGLLTGNLPDVPILREIYTFVHVKMLKGKHMMFGYEKSFTAKSISNLFREVGFRDIEIGLYDVEYTLKFFPYKPIKRLVRRLIRIRPFWPAIYICGRK